MRLASAYAGIADHQAIRAGFAAHDYDGNVAAEAVAGLVFHESLEGNRDGRIDDESIAWMYFPRRLWSGFSPNTRPPRRRFDHAPTSAPNAALASATVPRGPQRTRLSSRERRHLQRGLRGTVLLGMSRLLVLLVAIVVSACASGPTCPPYHAPGVARPFLWRVSAPNQPGTMVILATHQGVGAAALPARALDELDHADTYIAEADEVPAGLDVRFTPSLRPLFMLPDGTSLDRLIGSADFESLVDDLDATPESVRELRPWLAMMMLGRAAYAFVGPSMTEALVQRANDRTISLVFLETWSDQVRYLDAAITPRKLTAAIRGYDTMGCSIEQRVDAFRAGDDTRFINDVASPSEPVVARIVSWTARLHEHLYAGEHSFAALGIGQLVGPYGILGKLEALGYRVERL